MSSVGKAHGRSALVYDRKIHISSTGIDGLTAGQESSQRSDILQGLQSALRRDLCSKWSVSEAIPSPASIFLEHHFQEIFLAAFSTSTLLFVFSVAQASPFFVPIIEWIEA